MMRPETPAGMQDRSRPYVGRFAPSPTGPLHAGSLVAALASWLDARAHGGRWLVRIEDVDSPRCVPGAERTILQQLADCGLHPDGEVRHQSQCGPLYQKALDALIAQGHAYGCRCTRREIALAQAQRGWAKARHGDLVYPGTCRPDPSRGERVEGVSDTAVARAWRLTVPQDDVPWPWHDRALGPQQQVLSQTVGDFVIRRADGLWAYQLAVVVDDADQGVTDIVRGQDLADNTPRQQWLQRCLGLPTPRHLHTPLVLGPNGEKLSKQNGAMALDTQAPLQALKHAAQALALPALEATTVADWLHQATRAWAQRWLSTRD
jgi:glutamyl-Q tRNA(Asp) synthetase